MTDKQLVTNNSSLTILPSEEEPTIFCQFRELFRADRCSLRKIYWHDEIFGRTRLWEVQKINRKSKKEDSLVTIIKGKPDFDILKLAIAAKNQRRWLTGVRWEIYSDFACQKLEAIGRFDHLDLLPSDLTKLKTLIGEIGISFEVMNWDFDCLIATHRCPKCGEMYGKDVLSYIPEFMYCEHCGFNNTVKTEFMPANSDLIMKLLRMVTFEDLAIHTSPANSDKSELNFKRLYLGLLPTALICWIIGTEFQGRPFKSCLNSNLKKGIFPQEIRVCMAKSIFPFLRSEFFKKQFIRFFEEEYQIKKAKLEFEKRPSRIEHIFPSDEIYRQWKKKNLDEEKKDFLRDVNLVSDLESWFFQDNQDENKEKEFCKNSEKMAEVLKFFPDHLESLLTQLYKEYNEESI